MNTRAKLTSIRLGCKRICGCNSPKPANVSQRSRPAMCSAVPPRPFGNTSSSLTIMLIGSVALPARPWRRIAPAGKPSPGSSSCSARKPCSSIGGNVSVPTNNAFKLPGCGSTQATRHRLSQASTKLDLLSPNATLQRGYSITVVPRTGRIVRSVTHVQPGTNISTKVLDGDLRLCGIFNSRTQNETKEEECRARSGQERADV